MREDLHRRNTRSIAACGEDLVGCLSASCRGAQWCCRPWRTACWSRWTCPAGSCSLWTGAGALPCWELQFMGDRLEQAFLKQPMERTYAGAVLEEVQPLGRIYAGEVCQGLYPLGETSHWSRRTLRAVRSSRDEALWSDYNAHFWATQRGESRRTGNEAEPRNNALGGNIFNNFFFIFQYPSLLLSGNILMFLKLTCFCSWWQLMSDLPAFILTHELFFCLIFCPNLLRRKRRSECSVGVWQLAKVNTAQQFTFQTRYSSPQKQCFGTKD